MNVNLPTFVASVVGSTVASAALVAGFVNLQDGSPGTPQNGHANLSGNILAGRFGSGVAPSLARVQVKETGELQGVRAESGSGVAVFGKSTAATGLGAGGYFTSSSVGGRGIVGDALSGTGNTVGGLFYNRSSGGGVGVWGRAIGVGGTATGVLGETLSGAGTALAARNTVSENSLVAGTSEDSLLTDGALPRHGYTGGAAAMVPLAYGHVDFNGNKLSGTENWTATYNPTSDWYEITILGETYVFSTYATVVTIADSLAYVTTGSFDGKLLVLAWSPAGALTQRSFGFVVYKTDPTPQGGRPFAAPRHSYRTDGEWAAKRPKEYSAYLAARRAAEARPQPEFPLVPEP
jgi:hypothetical protein